MYAIQQLHLNDTKSLTPVELEYNIYYDIQKTSKLTTLYNQLNYSNLPPFLSIKAFLSLSKCNLLTTTLDGWMLIGMEAPLDFSFCNFSI